MKIIIMHDGLVFVDLTQEQLEKLETEKISTLESKENLRGIKIRGSKSDLYDLLAKLSYTYDLEIV